MPLADPPVGGGAEYFSRLRIRNLPFDAGFPDEERLAGSQIFQQ